MLLCLWQRLSKSYRFSSVSGSNNSAFIYHPHPIKQFRGSSFPGCLLPKSHTEHCEPVDHPGSLEHHSSMASPGRCWEHPASPGSFRAVLPALSQTFAVYLLWTRLWGPSDHVLCLLSSRRSDTAVLSICAPLCPLFPHPSGKGPMHRRAVLLPCSQSYWDEP